MLQLVNKPQARRLKKLGFDWKVKTLFIGRTTKMYLSDKMDIEENWNKFDYTISRPTIPEALEWLRMTQECLCEVVISDWIRNIYTGVYYFSNMPEPEYIRHFPDRSKAESELLTKILEHKFLRS